MSYDKCILMAENELMDFSNRGNHEATKTTELLDLTGSGVVVTIVGLAHIRFKDIKEAKEKIRAMFCSEGEYSKMRCDTDEFTVQSTLRRAHKFLHLLVTETNQSGQSSSDK